MGPGRHTVVEDVALIIVGLEGNFALTHRCDLVAPAPEDRLVDSERCTVEDARHEALSIYSLLDDGSGDALEPLLGTAPGDFGVDLRAESDGLADTFVWMLIFKITKLLLILL